MLVTALLPLAACQTTGSGAIDQPTLTRLATDVPCKAFKPFRWSTKDTRETQEQAVEHNAAYSELCLPKTTDK